MTTDCSDVASGAFIMAGITACVGFALGWFIKKAEMLQDWKNETDRKQPKSSNSPQTRKE